MAWLDLEEDLEELFAGLGGEAPHASGSRPPRAVTHLRAAAQCRPLSRRGRVLAAVAGGAHRPRAIAAAATLAGLAYMPPLEAVDVADVRHDLSNLKKEGRVRRGVKGWIL